MGFVKKVALLLGLAAAGLAVPSPQATDGGADPAVAAATNSTACATVAQSYAKQIAANPKGTRVPRVN